MKKIAMIAAISAIFFTSKTYACQYLDGSANLSSTGTPGEFILTCPGQGNCAYLRCDGKSIDIYINGGTITGTVNSPVILNPVGNPEDQHFTLEAPLVITVD